MATATDSLAPVKTRSRRSSSVIQYLVEPTSASEHHLLHIASEQEQGDEPLSEPRPRQSAKDGSKKKVKRHYGSSYLRWVQEPRDTLLILSTVVSLYAAWHLLFPNTANTASNPFSPFLFVSYPLPHKLGDPPNMTRFAKGPKDLLFLPFWIVAFSFLRQAVTLWVVKPLGAWLGIRKGRKMERFQEQGYAVVYFFCSSVAGLYVMSQQPSWFYKTQHFWLGYPHWDMTQAVKTYYLTQFAYWLQQALVMIAGLEKPRDDYVELVVHHIITLWLIGTSYCVNLTQIGIAVFVSMDIPDLLLAISKCINYCGLEKTGNCSFAIFLVTWGYFRHYQNIRILYSVWTESQPLTPSHAKIWSPSEGYFMPSWMRYQIFLPIIALQFVIAFWSYLILRILGKMIRGQNAEDVREEKEETETEGEGEGEVQVTGGVGGGARERREARQRRAKAG